MTSSGTYNFGLSNASIVFDAFDRIQLRPTQLDRHQLMSARTSLNLELLEWSNRGFNFWETTSGTINLAFNQATYTLPTSLVTLTELYYSAVNASTGVNQDRIMIPITRTQYAMIVNKLQQGIPTQYWFQMLQTPQVTIWEIPQAGAVAPNFVLNWYGLSQIKDANIAGGETPDIDYRAIEALITGLTLRLAEKFGPADPNARRALLMEKKAFADQAWDNMVRRDQEPGSTTYRPNIGVYGQMRR
jgi:hypothetical protein